MRYILGQGALLVNIEEQAVVPDGATPGHAALTHPPVLTIAPKLLSWANR